MGMNITNAYYSENKARSLVGSAKLYRDNGAVL